jgi:hypothetical protein
MQVPRPGVSGIGRKKTLTARREFQGGAASAEAPAKSEKNKSKKAKRPI